MKPIWKDAAQRVACEDLVMFVNACFACSGQREFYSEANEQTVSIAFLHEYILGNYRRLYARTLAAGINHFNQAQIIVNLLATGRDLEPSSRKEEGALILSTLNNLPTHRAYRVLETLRDRRINNRRTRAIIRDYLAGRPDFAFDLVKYRSRVRTAAVHAHLELPGEAGLFLFKGWHKRRFETPLLEHYRQAAHSMEALYELPYSVAEGFAAKHGIPRDRFLEGIAAKMTLGEKLRLQKTAERSGAKGVSLDLGRAPITQLALYILSLPVPDRLARRDELEKALEQAAGRTLRRTPQRLGRVASVLDRSYSSSGSSEKRRRPLAVALGVDAILRKAAAEYRVFWTSPVDRSIEVTPRGQTDLARPLLDALEWGADLVVLVSDGFENAPPGAAAELFRVYQTRLDRNGRTSVVHVNPVFDAQHYAPRSLGPSIPTVGLRSAEDLLTMLGFARFAAGHAPLSELEDYLACRVEKQLGGMRDRPEDEEETCEFRREDDSV